MSHAPACRAMGIRHFAIVTWIVSLALCACTTHEKSTVNATSSPGASSVQPIATLQDLMQSEVDASADEIWDAVETDITSAGEVRRQPKQPRNGRPSGTGRSF